MKRFFCLLVLFLASLSCEKDNNSNNNNPYLPNYSFDVTLNMSFPQYSSLAFPSNAVYVNSAGAGIRGLIVFQALADCSTMTINGINAECACDNAEYSLFTGLAAGKQYAMKAYRVQVIDETTIKVYN
jgi:hypothetical protein